LTVIKKNTSHIGVLGGITAEEKVGAFLVNLADRLAGRASWPVSLPISRYDIADLWPFPSKPLAAPRLASKGVA
jgi:hypothetical protein